MMSIILTRNSKSMKSDVNVHHIAAFALFSAALRTARPPLTMKKTPVMSQKTKYQLDVCPLTI